MTERETIDEYEKKYMLLNEREKEIFVQGFAVGHLRGFADGEAKQVFCVAEAHESFINDLRTAPLCGAAEI